MIDWSASMQQTFEFYEVDPTTWKDKKPLTTIKSGTINWDSSAETRGSATFDVTDSVGECYVRVYLAVNQNGEKDKFPLGTFLVQTPSSSFDGKTRSVSMDAYTPLLELKENQPPIGYYIPKGEDVMTWAYDLASTYSRAPVDRPIPSTKLSYNFVADSNDTWLDFVSDLITAAYTSTCYKVEQQEGEYVRTPTTIEASNGEKVEGVQTTTKEQVYSGTLTRLVSTYYCVVENGSLITYYKVVEEGDILVRTEEPITPVSGVAIDSNVKTNTGEVVYNDYISESEEGYYCVIDNITQYMIDVDELGHILFKPQRAIESQQPIWTYTDDNSSILYPDLNMDHDLYGIPNVVEILYSDGKVFYHSKAVNDDKNSPVSTVARGREIVYRMSNPELYGTVTQERLDEYAEKCLKTLSSVEYTISYTHGYCPVKVGDCIRFNYSKAGLTDVKAKVIYQSIRCEAGCPVSEKAVFTVKLWG